MNKIVEILKTKQIDGFVFRPTREFYEKIGVGQKRWGQLLRNEKPATIDELQRIAEYFQISITDLIKM